MTGAGQRDRLVTFERFVAVKNSLGQKSPKGWVEYCQAWANVSFGRGDERRAAGQVGGNVPATFRVLHNPLTAALSITDRISFDDASWQITSVVPYGRNRFIDVTAIRAAA